MTDYVDVCDREVLALTVEMARRVAERTDGTTQSMAERVYRYVSQVEGLFDVLEDQAAADG